MTGRFWRHIQKKEQDDIPKGLTRYSKHETALIKAARQMTKAVRRLQIAAAELEARPLPKPAPKTPEPAAGKVRQLRLPGTAPRKTAKAPAKRKRA